MLWTVSKAVPEFGLERYAFVRRLKEMGLDVPSGPSARKPWLTTKQCMEAVVGSLEKERTRVAAANADAQEMANQVARGDMIHTEKVLEIVRDRFAPMREALLSAPVTLAQKCNPADPPHAHAVICDWVDGVLRTGRREDVNGSRGRPSQD
jgi:phage terminase Nu1 subunit (DNA packaging protein)